MKFTIFYNTYALELYNLWYSSIPLKEGSVNAYERKQYTFKNRDFDYLEDDPIYEFIDVYDKGDRVTSFINFVYCAYENSIH